MNRMRGHGIDNWKWGLWAAVVITALSAYPQFVMWGVRGQQWNGSFAENDIDEWVYAAYVQALIDSRPRRNEPYLGRDDQPNAPQPESLFSIQFVPAYAIALPARLLGFSSSTAFIILGIVGPFFSCLAIFWLFKNILKDPRLAAAGCILVISFGALAAGQGIVKLVTSEYGYSYFLFLRRYQPLAAFPLFFLFCVFVWNALTAKRDVLWAAASGVTFGLLIFSYFYLWTTAAAWLACIALLWFIARPENRWRGVGSLLVILGLAVTALVPYFVLLSQRYATMDIGQKLALSHAPDLFRIPELLGIAVVILILFGAVRRRINWRAPETLFALAFSLMPLVVFNQQVITGRSLQPFHYEVFIANYGVLVGVVLGMVITWRGHKERRTIASRVVARLVFVAILWSIIEVVAPTKLITRFSSYTDQAAAVGQRLKQLAKSDGTFTNVSRGSDPRPLVFASNYKVALIIPAFAPHAMLWESHFEFLNLHPNEINERFFKYLYYNGIDRHELASELAKPMSNLAAAAFGHDRVIRGQSIAATPITNEDITKKVADYEAYIASFTREKAFQHLLSYVVVPADGSVDLANLDRWYQRDSGEQVGDQVLYRVQLRQ